MIKIKTLVSLGGCLTQVGVFKGGKNALDLFSFVPNGFLFLDRNFKLLD